MTDRRIFSRSASDEDITIEVLAAVLGITIEEAAHIVVEEGDTAIGELRAAIGEKAPAEKPQTRTPGVLGVLKADMFAAMKTVQIDDALFDQAMATAAVDGVNVRDLIESGLRKELKRRHRKARFAPTAGFKDDAYRDKGKPFSGNP